MRQAIDFMTSATQSGAHLYRELAVSAFRLVPAIASGVRSKAQSRQLSRVRDSLSGLPGATPTGIGLRNRSPQTL